MDIHRFWKVDSTLVKSWSSLVINLNLHLKQFLLITGAHNHLIYDVVSFVKNNVPSLIGDYNIKVEVQAKWR